MFETLASFDEVVVLEVLVAAARERGVCGGSDLAVFRLLAARGLARELLVLLVARSLQALRLGREALDALLGRDRLGVALSRLALEQRLQRRAPLVQRDSPRLGLPPRDVHSVLRMCVS